MPLSVADFVWKETDELVFIDLPMKSVQPNRVDIFATDEYLKVNYPPYLFECLLYDLVEEKKSSVQIGNGMVMVKLVKQQPRIWSQLQSNDAKNKEVMRLKREEAVKKSQEQLKEDKEKKAKDKRENERFALKELMKLEDEDRARINNIKEDEKRKATEELEKWKELQRQEAEQENQRLLEEKKENERARREEKKEQFRMRRKKKANIFENSAQGNALREVGKIKVEFTPREFPTPVRESVTPQEEEWLKKQAEVRKIAELQDKDLTEEEKNPLWLRDKGNSFFQAGNFHAAINAYTHAIRLNSRMPALYSNRAACHLKLRNFIKCITDCSKAFDLFQPPVPQNANSRCKVLVRRGTAFCELELYVEGLQDYEAALKIDPKNEKLQEDAEKIRSVIQGNS